jgi:hypothetical protein
MYIVVKKCPPKVTSRKPFQRQKHECSTFSFLILLYFFVIKEYVHCFNQYNVVNYLFHEKNFISWERHILFFSTWNRFSQKSLKLWANALSKNSLRFLLPIQELMPRFKKKCTPIHPGHIHLPSMMENTTRSVPTFSNSWVLAKLPRGTTFDLKKVKTKTSLGLVSL